MTPPADTTAQPFPWDLVAAGTGACAVVMLILWVLAWRHRDAGLVDVGWAACLGGLAVAWAVFADGSALQRTLAGALGGLWGLRLSLHLLTDRVLGAKQEDGRYKAMREHFGANANLHFLWFFQAQAVLAVALSLVFLLAARNPSEQIAPGQWFGLGLFVLAKLGETLADRQLARFRRDPSNTGRTCRSGLWRYSRHPNYFCEWLIWCAFALVATPAPAGLWAWLAPMVMFLFVTRVTGIPYTEQQSLRSRGEDYRLYQRETNAFFPWFPRTETSQ